MIGEIKTFKVSNGALQAAALPTRLKIFAWGDNDSIDGKYTVTDKTVSTLSVKQKAMGFERVAIDFDHCSVPGSDTQKELIKAGQPPLIFGYGRVNAIANDGVYLEDITWTPLGVQHAKNFEDLSPAIKDDNREVTFIHSVALTPNGKVNGLQFFSANHQPNKLMTIELADLAEIVGLSATATKQDVMAKLKERLTPAQAVDITPLSARIATLETKAPAGTDITPLTARLDKIEQQLKDTATAAIETERGSLIRLFAADGKVPKKADGANYSADELKTLDVPTLKLLHANTAVTVPLSARHATSQQDKQKTFKDDKGVVDLAALFDNENAASGQAAPNA